MKEIKQTVCWLEEHPQFKWTSSYWSALWRSVRYVRYGLHAARRWVLVLYRYAGTSINSTEHSFSCYIDNFSADQDIVLFLLATISFSSSNLLRRMVILIIWKAGVRFLERSFGFLKTNTFTILWRYSKVRTQEYGVRTVSSIRDMHQATTVQMTGR